MFYVLFAQMSDVRTPTCLDILRADVLAIASIPAAVLPYPLSLNPTLTYHHLLFYVPAECCTSLCAA